MLFRIAKSNQGNYQEMKLSFGKRDNFQFNQEMYQGIQQGQINSLMGIEKEQMKKDTVLKVSLQNKYSVLRRLQDPISSGELILLVKEMLDSLVLLMNQDGIEPNILVLDLDRVFITEQGHIRFLSWCNSAQTNANSIINLFYQIGQISKPRTPSDQNFLSEYNAIFADDNQSAKIEDYLNNIDTFISKKYTQLEQVIVQRSKEKGADVEENTGLTGEQAQQLREELQRKEEQNNKLDTDLTRVSKELDKIKDDFQEYKDTQKDKDTDQDKKEQDYLNQLSKKEKELTDTKEQISTYKQEITRLNEMLKTRPVQKVEPVRNSQPGHIQNRGVQPSGQKDTTFKEQTGGIAHSRLGVPDKKHKSITENLKQQMNKQYEEPEDDDIDNGEPEGTFNLGNGGMPTTVLNSEDEETPLKEYHLVQVDGKQNYLIREPESMIGKSKQCDIQITGDSAISGQHALFTLDTQKDELTIEDLNSTNGTYLNDERLNTNISYQVRPGMQIRLGTTDFEIKEVD